MNAIRRNFTTLEVISSRYQSSFAKATFNQTKKKIILSVINDNDDKNTLGLICYKPIRCYDTTKTGLEKINPLLILQQQGDF